MGGASSKAKAEINDAVDESMNILFSQTQDCNNTNNNVLDITQVSQDCTAGPAVQTISGIKIDGESHLNQDCAADFTVDADVSSSISQKFAQTADSVNSGFFPLNFVSSDSQTITNLMTKLSQNITSNSTQAVNEVTNNIVALNQFVTNCPEGSYQSIMDVDFSTFTDQSQSAIMTSADVVAVQDQLDQAIDQAATATNKGLDLNFLVAMIAAVAIGLFLVEYMGVKVVQGIFTPAGVVLVLAIVLLVLAYMFGWGPFPSRQQQGTGDDLKLACNLNSDCIDSMACVGGFCRLKCDTMDSGDECGQACDIGGMNCQDLPPCPQNTHCVALEGNCVCMPD